MKTRTIAALIVAYSLTASIGASLSGCAPTPNPPQVEAKAQKITRTEIPAAGAVYNIVLDDGTRCVIFNRRGGITCDWDGAKVRQP